MKILYIIHTPKDERTAVYKTCLQLKAAAEKAGHALDILAPDDFEELAGSSRGASVFYPLQAAGFLMKNAKKYDRVLFHSYSGWAALALKKYLGFFRDLKMICVFHGLLPLFLDEFMKEEELHGRPVSLRFVIFYKNILGFLIRFSCRAAGRVICLNRAEADYFMEHRIDKAKIKVLPNGAEACFYTEHRYPEKAAVLLFVGQWIAGKGIRYLISAYRDLAADFKDLKMILAGTGKEAERVLTEFPLELHARIKVYPSLTEKELAALYPQADIFVFPTLSEGFSLALLEALAGGLPVVATTAGAAPELIEHGKNGLLVRLRDPDALASEIKRLISDRELRENLGKNAQRKARDFELEKVQQLWLETLEAA